MIMHIFADWDRVRHNMAESLGIATVSTTKARGGIGEMQRCGEKFLVVMNYLQAM